MTFKNSDLNPHIDFTKIEQGSPGIHSGEIAPILTGKKKKKTVTDDADYSARIMKEFEAARTLLIPFTTTITFPKPDMKKKPQSLPKPDIRFKREHAIRALRDTRYVFDAFNVSATKEGAAYWKKVYADGHTPESIKKIKNMIEQFDKGTLK